MTNLTPASAALLARLIDIAAERELCPVLPGDLTAAERGNLTDLKAKGLLGASIDDDTCIWVEITDAGRAWTAPVPAREDEVAVTPPAPVEPKPAPVPAHPSEQPVTPPAPKLRTFDPITRTRMNLAQDFLQGASDPDRNATSCVDLAISFLVSATARLDGSADHLDYLLEQVAQNFQHAVTEQAEEG